MGEWCFNMAANYVVARKVRANVLATRTDLNVELTVPVPAVST